MELFETNWLAQVEIAIKVVIAGTFGGIVGLERELANRPAGLRTHALLASAAALLVGLGDLLIDRFAEDTLPQVLRADPLRIVEAIVTGVAFLGAGTIFRHHESRIIEGLTTGASLLLVSAIGIAVGLGQLLLAALVTLVSLVLLRLVGRILSKRG
ncbi:MAG TPA: MgtC/SapB family protein [Gammaproteobacteria bacterium]